MDTSTDAQQRKHEDRELDKALEDTFPASDPPAVSSPSSITGPEVVADEPEDTASREAHAKADAELDRELKQTFPASDTPSIVRKG